MHGKIFLGELGQLGCMVKWQISEYGHMVKWLLGELGVMVKWWLGGLAELGYVKKCCWVSWMRWVAC